MNLTERLNHVFYPRTIAVIGASAAPEKLGHACVASLLEAGFRGRIYPINPSTNEILGLTAYPSVGAVPGEIDLALIVLPARLTVAAAEECAARGASAAIVISSGFKEVGTEDGLALQSKLQDIASRSGMIVIGPNTMGVVNPRANLVASFQSSLTVARAGSVAVATQSGGMCIHTVHALTSHNMGISKAIGLGNRCALDFDDIVAYFLDDDETRVIVLYLEGLQQPRRLMKVVRDGVSRKPVVVLKGGRDKASNRATLSHTGALAGQYPLYKAAFTQSGMITANNTTELVDIAKALALQPPAAGERVAVLCVQAGLGIVAADRCRELGLKPAEFAPATREQLRQLIPPLNAVDNPVDVAWKSNYFNDSHAILKTVMDDNGVDAVVIAAIFWEANMPLMRAAIEIAREYDKPIAVCLDSPRGIADHWLNALEEGNIPTYPTPERAATGLAGLVRYGEILNR
jgi:acyl-CoA synthetase (NDP forming)